MIQLAAINLMARRLTRETTPNWRDSQPNETDKQESNAHLQPSRPQEGHQTPAHRGAANLIAWARCSGHEAEEAHGGTSVDLSSVIIAVAGVAGTLGGALLTQRGSERAKRLEIELVRDHEEVRENRSLRRTCYAELNRDARQFTTALNRHLHVMRERGVEEADSDILEEAKNAHRDRYSEAQMIAPEEVLMRASVVTRH